MSTLEKLFRLDGKVIVVTGAAGLLGQQFAEAIAAFGGTPVLLDIRYSEVKSLARKLSKQYNTKVFSFDVDITRENNVRENSILLEEMFGKIDGLVNNAANNPRAEVIEQQNLTRLETFSLDLWNQDIAVGLTGAYLCAKHYGFRMTNNPAGGVIVNIASDLALISPDQRLYAGSEHASEAQPVKPVSYSVVKTGLIGLTRYLATYWVDRGVRCNAVCPGGVEDNQSEHFLKQITHRIPMNRLAKSNEYQGTLIWMLSDASSYLNGAVVAVDGGRTVW